MALKDTIKDDMKAAFKAGDQQARTTLSMLLSTIQNRELEKRSKLIKAGSATEADVAEKSQLTDEEVIDAVTSEIKKRRESVATYTTGGRPELAAAEQAEIAVFAKYLPEQLTEDAVVKLIDDAVVATGAAGPKDIGKVMGAVTPKTKGRFDGTRISELVKQRLGA
jgi:uncharacterized protein YqeY